MKKFFLCLVAVLVICSCQSQVLSSKMGGLPEGVSLSGDDFIFGPILEYSKERSSMEPEAIENILQAEVLSGSGWDVILFPRYIYEMTGGKEMVTIVGRAAKLKTN